MEPSHRFLGLQDDLRDPFFDGLALLSDLVDGGGELPVEGAADVEGGEEEEDGGGEPEGNPSGGRHHLFFGGEGGARASPPLIVLF